MRYFPRKTNTKLWLLSLERQFEVTKLMSNKDFKLLSETDFLKSVRNLLGTSSLNSKNRNHTLLVALGTL